MSNKRKSKSKVARFQVLPLCFKSVAGCRSLQVDVSILLFFFPDFMVLVPSFVAGRLPIKSILLFNLPAPGLQPSTHTKSSSQAPGSWLSVFNLTANRTPPLSYHYLSLPSHDWAHRFAQIAGSARWYIEYCVVELALKYIDFISSFPYFVRFFYWSGRNTARCMALKVPCKPHNAL